MCQLVIAIAVQSDNNKRYIEMIQSLTQKSQHALMVSIEEVMSHFNAEPDTSSNNRLSYLSGHSTVSGTKSFQLEDMPYRYQLEFEKILLEKKQFETSHSQLLGEYSELRERFVSLKIESVVYSLILWNFQEDLLAEKEDLKTRLHDMDEAISQANSTGKADYVMRTEIEHLKQDLYVL